MKRPPAGRAELTEAAELAERISALLLALAGTRRG